MDAEASGSKRQTTSAPQSVLTAAVRFSATRCQRGMFTEGSANRLPSGTTRTSVPLSPNTMTR